MKIFLQETYNFYLKKTLTGLNYYNMITQTIVKN